MKRALVLILLFCAPAWATNPATGVYEIRASATAGNVNGCGFNSARAGTDYTLQDAAQLHSGDGVSTASTTFTSVTAGFTDAMKGNYLHLVSATGADEVVGWHEIVSVTNGTTLVLDKATGTYTVGDFYIGGACRMNSALDDDLFESAVPGNIFYVRQAAGTVTMGEAVTVTTGVGGAQLPIRLVGYTTDRTAVPTGTNRPLIAGGSTATTFAANWRLENFRLTTSVSGGLNVGAAGQIINVQSINSSTTANLAAFTLAADAQLINSEGVSYNGRAVSCTTFTCHVVNSWLHDSNIGIFSSATGNPQFFVGNLVTSNVVAAIALTGAQTSRTVIENNTLVGGGSATNKTGIGVSMVAGVTDVTIRNNSITWFATGVSHADTQSQGYDNYNNYYQNTADVSAAGQWQKGPNDTALNPGFGNVGQVVVTTASTSSTAFTKAGATFVTSGVVAGRDYLYIVADAQVTGLIHEITVVVSETELTLAVAPGNSAGDLTGQITTGQNFYPGAAISGAGFPGAVQGGYTTGYQTPGAIQRNGASSGTVGIIGG